MFCANQNRYDVGIEIGSIGFAKKTELYFLNGSLKSSIAERVSHDTSQAKIGPWQRHCEQERSWKSMARVIQWIQSKPPSPPTRSSSWLRFLLDNDDAFILT
eukprot:355772_1